MLDTGWVGKAISPAKRGQPCTRDHVDNRLARVFQAADTVCR